MYDISGFLRLREAVSNSLKIFSIKSLTCGCICVHAGKNINKVMIVGKQTKEQPWMISFLLSLVITKEIYAGLYWMCISSFTW